MKETRTPSSTMAFFPLAILATNWTRLLSFDDTFAGIHQLAWFDWALLVPYFSILALLSVYGLHRYETIRTYFKHRKSQVHVPKSHFEELPRSPSNFPCITSATWSSD